MKHFKIKVAALAIILTIGSAFTVTKAKTFSSLGIFKVLDGHGGTSLSDYETTTVYTQVQIISDDNCPDDGGAICGADIDYHTSGSTLVLDQFDGDQVFYYKAF